MARMIYGIALEHPGWPPATSYDFEVRPGDIVMRLRGQCATELGVLKDDVQLWKASPLESSVLLALT